MDNTTNDSTQHAFCFGRDLFMGFLVRIKTKSQCPLGGKRALPGASNLFIVLTTITPSKARGMHALPGKWQARKQE
jgi:hypothetical protein